MRKLTADRIYPIDSEPVQNGVIIVDQAGKILALDKRENHDPAELEQYNGFLVPGFVNTHCHLELSHMLGMVDTGTGLLPFITNVVTRRNMPPEVVAEAIRQAEQAMYDAGIVAVGDISNVPDSFEVKQSGRMRWYTFVELFDFLQNDRAASTFIAGKKVFDQLTLASNSAKSLVPHAPYSVSASLFALIREANPEQASTVSIHNQETPPEEHLFLNKQGAFLDFYGKFNIPLDDFQPTGQPSIYYALQHLDPDQRTLFVHNTLTSKSDIEAAHAWSGRVYWATCANANLYIENRLPNYRHFLDTDARLTIGTDSLTSNWQLSILEELKTIARYQSYVPTEALLRWATLNGAEALGFDDSLGSFTVGKTPGLLLLEGMSADGRFVAETRVRRLI